MSKYKPPLVIIAPKGEDYSSISDEEFTRLSNSFEAFTEITLQQYCDWVHFGNTVIGRSVRTGTSPHNISVNLKRYKSRMVFTEGGGGEGEDVLHDFDGFYAGHFSAKEPKNSDNTLWYQISGADEIDSKFVNSGSFTTSNETYIIASSIREIKLFYHRNKFYLVWEFRPTWGNPYYGFSWETTPTSVSFTETTTRVDGTIASTRTYSYELQPN